MADDMTSTTTEPAAPATPAGFPWLTAGATLLGLGLFAVLVLVAYTGPNAPADKGPDAKADPYTRKREVDARNQAVLDNTAKEAGVKGIDEARAEVLAAARKTGALPLPVPPANAAPKAAPQPKEIPKTP